MTSKPSLSSIFNRKTPAAAVDVTIPKELPAVILPTTSAELKAKIKEEADKKTGISSKNNEAKKKVMAKIEKTDLIKDGKLLSIIASKKCKLYYDDTHKNYITSNSASETIILYVKLVDGNGTPFYLNLGDYGGDIRIPTENFEGTTVVLNETKIPPEQIKYLIASNKTNNQLIECGENKFCVITNTDAGNNKVDIYEIPNIEEIKKIKEETEGTQTSKPQGSLNIENNVLLSYNLFNYNEFVSKTDREIMSENLKHYNRQLETISNIAKINMENIKFVYNDLGFIISSFEKNYNKAITKSIEIRNRIRESEKDEDTRIKKCKKINENIEDYIREANKYNKELINCQRTFKNLLVYNNTIVDKYEEIKNLDI